MNRYTQITPAGFDPLSVEEIMLVPLGKQKRHDEQQAILAEAGIIDANRITPDEEAVRETISDFKSRVEGVSEELNSKGISRGVVKNVIDLKKEREHLLSQDGILGRAETAHKALAENMKAINADKDLTKAQKYYGIQKAISDYGAAGGAREGATYNPYIGAKKVELTDRALKYAKELSPQTIRRLASDEGYELSADGTRWIKGTIETTRLPIDVIARGVAGAMASDTEVAEYLADLDSLGIDMTANLQNAIMSASALKVRDDWKMDMTASNVSNSNSTSSANGPYLSSHIGPQQYFAQKYPSYENLVSQASDSDNPNYEKAKNDLNHYHAIIKNDPEYLRLYESKERIAKNAISFKEDAFSRAENPQEIQDNIHTWIANAGKIPYSGNINSRLKVDNGKLYYRLGDSDDTIDRFENHNIKELSTYPHLMGNEVIEIGDINMDNIQFANRTQDDMTSFVKDRFDNATKAQVYSYNVLGLPNEKKNAINRDIRSNLIIGGINNYRVLNIEGNNEGDAKKLKKGLQNPKENEEINKKVFDLIQAAEPNSFEVLSLQENALANIPSMRVMFNIGTGSDAQTYDVEIGIDKLTNVDGIRSGEELLISFVEQNGGPDGKLIADDMRKGIFYKDIDVNASQFDFSKSTSENFKKNLLSKQNDEKLTESFGEGYDINIYTENTGIGSNYAISVKDPTGEYKNLTWKDIIRESDLDFESKNDSDGAYARRMALFRYAIENEYITTDGSMSVEQINEVINDIASSEYYPILSKNKNVIFDLLRSR